MGKNCFGPVTDPATMTGIGQKRTAGYCRFPGRRGFQKQYTTEVSATARNPYQIAVALKLLPGGIPPKTSKRKRKNPAIAHGTATASAMKNRSPTVIF